jgi:ubiquinone/menaquinone biosynthesis C-methylase UbiE
MLRGVIVPGDLVVDATAGNGYDTVFLAEAVGEGGRVLAFDVQACALAAARGRVADAGVAARVDFHHESHANMAERAEAGRVAAVMWNLGYLPGGDHGVITSAAETLRGLEAAARVLKPGGWLTVLCYPGHAGGDEETSEVMEWLQDKARNGWRVAKYEILWTRRPAPCLMVAVAG